LLLLLTLAACERELPLLTLHGASMGTTWSVKTTRPPMPEEQLRLGIQAVLDRIDGRMSTYRTDSEVSRFNRAAAGVWLPTSAETVRVVAEALRIGRLTAGAFDISVGPLVDLWGFGPDFHPDRIPAQDTITEALRHTGYNKIAFRTQVPALRKSDPATHIDLSGIAKGYAVDALGEYLLGVGVHDFMAEVGGEVTTRGHNPSGRAWRIAVEKPREGGRQVEQILELRDQGMATSGDYRNYFVIDGVRYSHTIDPVSGWPVRHRPASASVVHASAMTADALATAMLVLGRDKGMALARREGLAVLLIERDGQRLREHVSDAFRRLQQSSEGQQ